MSWNQGGGRSGSQGGDLLLSWDDAPQQQDSDQEAKDRALALQLEAQFKEESRAAAAAAASAQSTRNTDLIQQQSPQFDSQSLIQCPLCGNWIEAGDADFHVNSCLDSVLANQINAEEEALERHHNLTHINNGLASSHQHQHQRQPQPQPQQQVRQRQQHDPVTKEPFECPICTENVAVGSGYKLECGHSYCGECLAGYFKTLIMNGKVLELKCPSPGCDLMCASRDVRFVSPDDVYNKYVEFSRNAQLSKNPNVRWCPTPGCDTAVEREDPQSQLLSCPTCSFEFCFDCSKAFHPGKTCEQANRFSLFGGKDIRVVLWEKFNTKPCPNCKAPIQKSRGCNHMTCGSCRHDFCWQCMEPYTDDHFEETRCTMYERSPALFYLKAVGRILLRRDSSDDSSSSSDDETLLQKIDNKLEAAGEKLSDVKEDLSIRLEATKEDIIDAFDSVAAAAKEKFSNFRGLFTKRS